MAIAASALIGCGGGGGDEDSSTSSAQQAREAQAQAEADAVVRANNEKVREAYQERQDDEAPSEEEVQATQTAAEAYRGLSSLSKLRYLKGDFDVKAGLRMAEGSKALQNLCGFMSHEAQEQTIAYAEQSSGIGGGWTCERANALLIRRANVASGGKSPGKVRVLGVNADGDRATATIQLGEQPTTSVALVKEDGEWKLAATATGGKR